MFRNNAHSRETEPMAVSHLRALQKKHEKLEEKIHQESTHAARDDQAIKKMKLERLHIQEEIARLQAH
jgi:hypothetical protein